MLKLFNSLRPDFKAIPSRVGVRFFVGNDAFEVSRKTNESFSAKSVLRGDPHKGYRVKQ